MKSNYWAPTAFTPNGDGRDDIFYIHGQFQQFDFGVYSRWGEQIFHTNNPTQGWDGTSQASGEKMPDGAYIYYVKGKLSDGTTVSKQDMVNLIR
jgi:gliding motility-associated-like protein